MSEATDIPAVPDAAQEPTAQEASDQAAVARYKESLEPSDNPATATPEGYNDDGTPKEELIAGKFKSQEDLVKAYSELEQKLGQPKEEVTPPEAPTDSQHAAQDGFSAAKYEQEFASNGELSEASYKELEKSGFNKGDVDRYIQGQTAYSDAMTSKVYEKAGGQEQYTALVTWAAENADPAVVTEYNEALASMDEGRITRTLEYMTYKMNESIPADTRRLEGDSPSTGLQPFSDKNEWQKAQTNRLYGKDRNYTAMVDKRYLASRKKGIL